MIRLRKTHPWDGIPLLVPRGTCSRWIDYILVRCYLSSILYWEGLSYHLIKHAYDQVVNRLFSTKVKNERQYLWRGRLEDELISVRKQRTNFKIQSQVEAWYMRPAWAIKMMDTMNARVSPTIPPTQDLNLCLHSSLLLRRINLPVDQMCAWSSHKLIIFNMLTWCCLWGILEYTSTCI